MTTTAPDNVVGPNGETGWPWSTESPADPPNTQSSTDLPRISVVVPSYNQGRFIEATIRSILLQEYPNLELFVMDGGSNDETVEILKRYDKWIDHWESQPDRGQSHAVNKGWYRSDGAIVAFLNSDDLYTPGALLRVGKAFMDNPGCSSVSGNTSFETLEHESIQVKEPKPFDTAHYLHGGMNPGQPAVFLARETYQAVGELDESMSRSLDRDYWIRIGLRIPDGVHVAISQVLAIATVWEGNNATLWEGTATDLDYRGILDEHIAILDKTFALVDLPSALRALRRKAYSTEYMSYAMSQARINRRREATRFALKSVMSNPRMLVSKSLVKLFRAMIVGR